MPYEICLGAVRSRVSHIGRSLLARLYHSALSQPQVRGAVVEGTAARGALREWGIAT